MSLSNSITHLLDSRNVKYTIAQLSLQGRRVHSADAGKDTSPCQVRSVILKDGLGKVQVLMPEDCLLDLNVLNQQLVRQLRAISPEELQAFLSRYQADSVPALPTSGLTTVVDDRLFQSEWLLLDSGTHDQMLEIDQTDFQSLITDATTGNFCVHLGQLMGPTPDSDSSQNTYSIKNFTTLRIKQRLDETLELPLLPSTAQRIINLRVDPSADIDDLASVVESDPSLAAQVVSWATSPYYSAPGKILSVHDAILRVLGFDMVLNLSLGLALGRPLRLAEDDPNGVTPYWQEAIYTAATVEGLVNAIPRDKRPGYGMAYLSGLLHNFGFLILAEVFPPHFEKINRYTQANPHVPPSVIDRHVLGVTREQLASWLMEVWNMPEEVITALRYQQEPGYQGDNHQYAKLLYVANSKLKERNMGTGPAEEIQDAVYEQLHLQSEQAENAVESVMESTEELNISVQQLAG